MLVDYDRSWLRGDLIAGITVAAYLIPQVLAYAKIIGLPPVAGLWAMLAPVVIYALLGTSRQFSLGPEATSSLMTAAAIAAVAGAVSGERRAEVAALLAVTVGLLLLVGSMTGMGYLANLLSKPVLVGYLAGIGLLMVASQFGALTKLTISGDNLATQTWSLLSQFRDAHLATVLLSLVVIVMLFGLQTWRPGWPGPLIVVLGAALVVKLTGLADHGLAVIGDLPKGFPRIGWPDLTGIDLTELVLAALGISVVVFSTAVLGGRAFATKHGQQLESNSELFAVGAANLANGLVGGFPVSSSASRMVIGDLAGARTQVHSLVAAGVVLVTVFWLSPVLEWFPQAALAGLVVFAGIRLIEIKEFRRLASFRVSELTLALITFAAVLATGMLYGIAIAVGLSLLDLIRRIAQPHDGVLGFVPGVAGMHDIEDYPHATQVRGLLVYRYDSPLFFANAEDFRTRALKAVDAESPPPLWFVLNAEANVEVDLTAVDALEELRVELQRRDIVFAMARVKMDLRAPLAAAGFIQAVGEDRIFATLPTAVAAFNDWHQENVGHHPESTP